MTKPEITGIRPLGFSAWSREKLKDSKLGLVWTDVDCILHDYWQKRYMILEVKTLNGHLRYPQSKLLKVLDSCFRIASKTGVTFDYWGFYLIRMSGPRPDESDIIYINDALISESDLIKHLNFEKKYKPLRLFDIGGNHQ